ncbi:MAG: hypothetical protein AMXMBFR47_13770 [Planctomycetota bacterium]
MPLRRRARYCSRCGRGVPRPAVVRLLLAGCIGFVGLVAGYLVLVVAMLVVAALRDCGAAAG